MKNANEADSLSTFIASCVSRAEGSQEIINEFADKVRLDPAHALEWGDRAFKAAADVKIYGTVAAWGGPSSSSASPLTARQLADRVNRLLVSRARQVPSSSSGASNLLDQHVTAAWAEIAEQLNWLLEE